MNLTLEPAHQPRARMTSDRLGTDGPTRLLIDPHVGRRQPPIASRFQQTHLFGIDAVPPVVVVVAEALAEAFQSLNECLGFA